LLENTSYKTTIDSDLIKNIRYYKQLGYEHPENLATAYIYTVLPNMDEEFLTIYEGFSPELKNSEWGTKMSGHFRINSFAVSGILDSELQTHILKYNSWLCNVNCVIGSITYSFYLDFGDFSKNLAIFCNALDHDRIGRFSISSVKFKPSLTFGRCVYIGTPVNRGA